MIHLSRLWLDPMSRRVQKELAAPYQMHRTLCHAFPGLSQGEWQGARVLFRADEEEGKISLLVQSKIEPNWANFAAKVQGRYLLASPNVNVLKTRHDNGEPRFETGQSLRFRLQANPVFAPKENGAKNGTRRGLYREAERLDWLRRQGETHGFEMDLGATTLQAWVDSAGKRHPIFFRGERKEDELPLDLPLCEVIDLNSGRLESEKNLAHSQPARRTLNQPMPLEAGKDDGALPRITRFGSGEFSAARFDGLLRVSDPEKFAVAVENGIGKARGFGFGLLSVAPATK